MTNLLNGELYFTAGEQEIKNSSENFKKRWLFRLTLIKKDIRLLLNSSSDVKNIKIKLKNFLKKILKKDQLY